jgi:hypothetical protein
MVTPQTRKFHTVKRAQVSKVVHNIITCDLNSLPSLSGRMPFLLLLVAVLGRVSECSRSGPCSSEVQSWKSAVVPTYPKERSNAAKKVSKVEPLFRGGTTSTRGSCARTANFDSIFNDVNTLVSIQKRRIVDTTKTVSSSMETAYNAVQHRVSERLSLASQLMHRRKMTLQLAASNIAASTTKSIHEVRAAASQAVQRCITTISPTNRATAIVTDSTLGIRQPKATYLFAPKERESIIQQTHDILQNVQNALRQDSLWELINESDGVKVWRTFVDIKGMNSNGRSSTANDVAVIRSEAILNSSPQKVYSLFMDNSRVHEYNDNCVELHDIEYLNSNTKVNWCATGKFGPFKARDFVTAVHFRELVQEKSSHGVGYVSIAANIEHSKLPPTTTYVRSQIQLAATLMIPIPGQPNKTKFVQVTQVGQLGGVADSKMAKKITQSLAEKAPVDFCKKFDRALQSAPLPKPNRSSSGLPFAGIVSLSEM